MVDILRECLSWQEALYLYGGAETPPSEKHQEP